jgi:TonB family protein
MYLRNLFFMYMQEILHDKAVFPCHSKDWISLPLFYALLIVPICIGSLCWVPQVFSEEFSESEIETLDVIEVTGQTLKSTTQAFSFPLPIFRSELHKNFSRALPLPEFHIHRIQPHTSPVLIDQTGKIRGIVSPVKPLKTERPPYPRRARESGWQGRVILQLSITPHGRVLTADIHESSGYSLLDDSAIQAAKNWTFEPAKNGGFPVASTVNIPIQFDLVQ